MFNVGDIVECIDRQDTTLKLYGKYKVDDIFNMSDGLQLLKIGALGWFAGKRFVLVTPAQKVYFCNDNRTLMTEDEAMEYLRKNGGGTLYKKVLTMSFETKTEEKIERF